MIVGRPPKMQRFRLPHVRANRRRREGLLPGSPGLRGSGMLNYVRKSGGCVIKKIRLSLCRRSTRNAILRRQKTGSLGKQNLGVGNKPNR